MSFKYWSKYILLITILFFIIIASFNYIINPYSIFTHKLFSTFLKTKDHIVSERMLTFYTAEKVKPNNLMVGSSRIGLFSKSEIEKYLSGTTFNMAMPGSNIEEQTQYMKYMINNYEIKNIIWGLDFYSFNPDLQNDSDFSYNRLNPTLFLRNDFKIALLSLQTTKNSFKTLKDNLLINNNKVKTKKVIISIIKSTKKKKSTNPPLIVLSKEQIIQKTNDLLESYTKKYFNSNKFKNPESILINIKKMKDIINLCEQKNVKLYIYTSPVQIKFINLYTKLGLKNTFQKWKIELSNITQYTDFCYSNSVTNNLYNFMDGSHIMPTYGEKIFSKVFNDTKINTSSDFGKTIDKKN